MRNYFYCILSIFILTSCVTRHEKQGYMFELSDHEMIQEGITSKEKVLKIMGSPTIISDFDDEAWIYYSEDVKKLLFFLPDIEKRDVLVLRFDKFNVVNKLQKIDLADGAKVSFASNYTSVDSHKTGIFKSFFSNVGQVRPQ